MDSGRKGNCRHAKKSTSKGRIRYCSKHQGVCEVHHWVWTKAIDLGCVSCLAKAAAKKKEEDEQKEGASDGDDEHSEPEAAGGDEAEVAKAAAPTEEEQASDGYDADAEPEAADPVVAVAPVWREKRKRSPPVQAPEKVKKRGNKRLKR